MPEPFYTTIARVKDEPGASALGDDAALAAIVEAEDLIDRIAGPRSAEPTTDGRAFAPQRLMLLQSRVLSDVTAQLAARMALEPTSFVARGMSTVKGPDFETVFGGVDAAGKMPPAGIAAVRNAASKLERAGLRSIVARLA